LSGRVEFVACVFEETRFGNLQFVGGKKEDVRARAVHFVGFTRVDRFSLFEGVELFIEDLCKIHYNGLVDFLPQVSTKNLN
jgi:hypothetical protein